MVMNVLDRVHRQIVIPTVAYLQAPESLNMRIWTGRAIGMMVIRPIATDGFYSICSVATCKNDPYLPSVLFSALVAILTVEVVQNRAVQQLLKIPIRFPVFQ